MILKNSCIQITSQLLFSLWIDEKVKNHGILLQSILLYRSFFIKDNVLQFKSIHLLRVRYARVTKYENVRKRCARVCVRVWCSIYLEDVSSQSSICHFSENSINFGGLMHLDKLSNSAQHGLLLKSCVYFLIGQTQLFKMSPSWGQ